MRINLTKKDLVNEVYMQVGFSKQISENLIEEFFFLIIQSLKEQKKISLDDLEYRNSRDYFRSGIRICQNEGLRFSKGFDCKIKSQIPIKAGTSSSSALMVSWINFLSRMADDPVKWDQKKIAEEGKAILVRKLRHLKINFDEKLLNVI